MREAGAYTISQDEESSVVFGMPKKAIEIGAAQEIVSLKNVPRTIINSLTRKMSSTAHLDRATLSK